MTDTEIMIVVREWLAKRPAALMQNEDWIELARAILAASALDRLTAEQERLGLYQEPWQTGTPPTKSGDYDEYIVAVRRKAVADRVFVFASNYANSYGAEDLHDRDGDEYIAHGWYTIGHDTSGEYDSLFMPMLEDGDEVLGWQPLPKWNAAATPSAKQEPQFTVNATIVHAGKLKPRKFNFDNDDASAKQEPIYCAKCDGEGVVHTGISEASTTQCSACEGTGYAAPQSATEAKQEPIYQVRSKHWNGRWEDTDERFFNEVERLTNTYERRIVSTHPAPDDAKTQSVMSDDSGDALKQARYDWMVRMLAADGWTEKAMDKEIAAIKAQSGEAS